MKVGIIGCGAIANIIASKIVPEESEIEIKYFCRCAHNPKIGDHRMDLRYTVFIQSNKVFNGKFD